MPSRKQQYSMGIADYSPSVIAGRKLIDAAKVIGKNAIDHTPAKAVYDRVKKFVKGEKRDSSGKWTASMSQGKSRRQRYVGSRGASMGVLESLLQVTGGRHRDKHGRSLTGGYRVRDTPENRAITEKHGAHKIGGIGERARDGDGKFAGFGGKYDGRDNSRGPLFLSSDGSRKQRYLSRKR